MVAWKTRECNLNEYFLTNSQRSCDNSSPARRSQPGWRAFLGGIIGEDLHIGPVRTHQRNFSIRLERTGDHQPARLSLKPCRAVANAIHLPSGENAGCASLP